MTPPSIPLHAAWFLKACPGFLQFLPTPWYGHLALGSLSPGKNASPAAGCLSRAVLRANSLLWGDSCLNPTCWFEMCLWKVFEVSPGFTGRCHSGNRREMFNLYLLFRKKGYKCALLFQNKNVLMTGVFSALGMSLFSITCHSDGKAQIPRLNGDLRCSYLCLLKRFLYYFKRKL